ncbi:hypothetical protein CORC01_13292 [Colletotrichum orchidophilum]|uniref:Uncharacterized protein n=1 Tax=Colletotrichum orchidophilum TaxID=1209926 RepID=A0A1G4AQH8_9PEZI|nr:uncharacterized protein CORC01_13292 [Colletotrichum orchidophilum]OHE91427.1 hypothetical protein CORC01_13292 [Colletotrichum orchidophilum]
MAPVVSGEVVFTYDKKAKEKVRKCGGSAKRKAVQLGQGAGVFSAVIHFNPTYGQLDGAVYIPEGQSIPDVNHFLAELANGERGTGGQRRVTRRRRKKTAPESSQIPVETTEINVGEFGSIMHEEPNTVADATANEVTSEDADADAPHEIEADGDGAVVFGGTASDAQQEDAHLDEDTKNQAEHELSTDTELFNHDVNGMMEDYVMIDTDTAGATGAGEESSFFDLLEDGLQDLFEMEAFAPSLGSYGDSELGEMEGRSSDTILGRERLEVETWGETEKENTAATTKGASSHQMKAPQTRTTAATRACRPARNTQKIHRFFLQVSRQIRLARQRGELDTGYVLQTRRVAKQLARSRRRRGAEETDMWGRCESPDDQHKTILSL